MAAQDVGELVPRVRRAIEGPIPLVTGDPEFVSDEQLLALVADTIADVILLTEGRWGHTLEGIDGPPATQWTVDPGLSLEEESLVAAQAALTRYFHIARQAKVAERIQNEGQTWEVQHSAQLLREQYALLKDTRDRALAAVMAAHPVMARYASILSVRDRLGAALLEPWRGGGVGGGQEAPGSHWLPAGP
jgi:hypothetical protein